MKTFFILINQSLNAVKCKQQNDLHLNTLGLGNVLLESLTESGFSQTVY